MDEKKYFEANRKNWDERVGIHIEDPGEIYDIPGFLEGKTTLKTIELDMMGDVAGKTFLHLMCHFGLDTLSWARYGAYTTGVDFSTKAVSVARMLAKRIGENARFVHADIYELRDRLEGDFDIVFASYGVLCWLSDVTKFMAVVSHFLKPGGIFIIVDVHPIVEIFEYDAKQKRLDVRRPYFHRQEPDICEVNASYTSRTRKLQNTTTYQWSHDLGSIVNAALWNGLAIISLQEYPFLCYKRYPEMYQGEDGYWRFSNQEIELPMLFSLKAVKPCKYK